MPPTYVPTYEFSNIKFLRSPTSKVEFVPDPVVYAFAPVTSAIKLPVTILKLVPVNAIF